MTADQQRHAPQAFGTDGAEFERAAYSPAVRVGDLVFVSGQVAMSDTGEPRAVGRFREQGDLVFERLRRVLESAGSGLEHVVKVTIFLTDAADFPELVRLRKKWLTPPYPADSTVIVQSLAREEFLLEIEADRVDPALGAARRSVMSGAKAREAKRPIRADSPLVCIPQQDFCGQNSVQGVLLCTI